MSNRRNDDGVRRPKSTIKGTGPAAKPVPTKFTGEHIKQRLVQIGFLAVVAISVAIWISITSYNQGRDIGINARGVQKNCDNITALDMRVTDLNNEVRDELDTISMIITGNADLANMTIMDILLAAMNLTNVVNEHEVEITDLQSDVGMIQMDLMGKVASIQGVTPNAMNIGLFGDGITIDVGIPDVNSITLRNEGVRTVEGRTPDGSGNVNVNGAAGITINTPDANTVEIDGTMLESAINNLDSTVTTQGMQITDLQNQFDALETAGEMIAEALNGTVLSFNMTLDQLIMDVLMLQQQLAALSSISTGMIIPFAPDLVAIPSGFLACDGTQYATAAFPDLFGVIGDAYCTPIACGAGIFQMPDLRGRVPAGIGGDVTYFGMRGQESGETTHMLTAAQLASHTHSFSGSTGDSGHHIHQIATDVGSLGARVPPPGTFAMAGAHQGAVEVTVNHEFVQTRRFCTPLEAGFFPQECDWFTDIVAKTLPQGGGGAHSHSVSGTTGGSGSDSAHPNVQPSLAINYIIKT